MSIRLHKEKGLNPHMTVCERCGDDIGIALLGASDTKYECQDCGQIMIGKRKCPKCKTYAKKIGVLEKWVKLPGGLCEKCTTEITQFEEVVKAGGIYLKCKDCNMSGVLKGEHPMAMEVRKDVPAPDPIGIELDKNNCPQCGPGNEQN